MTCRFNAQIRHRMGFRQPLAKADIATDVRKRLPSTQKQT